MDLNSKSLLFTPEEIEAMLEAEREDARKLQADEIAWRRKSERRMGVITGPLFGPDQEEMF